MNDKEKEIAICRSLYLGRFKLIEEENEKLRMNITSKFIDDGCNEIKDDEDILNYFEVEENEGIILDLIIKTTYITIFSIHVLIEKYAEIYISYFKYEDNGLDFALINPKNNTYDFDVYAFDKQKLDDYVFSRLNFFVLKYKKNICIRNDHL